MGRKANLIRIGNSQGIIIPKAIAELLGWNGGDVEMTATPDGAGLVIRRPNRVVIFQPGLPIEIGELVAPEKNGVVMVCVDQPWRGNTDGLTEVPVEYVHDAGRYTGVEDHCPGCRYCR